MKLLITGASGCVGSHVALEARKRGLSVRALVRSGRLDTLLHGSGAEVVRGDLCDQQSLKGALTGISHVVHCAAAVGAWGNDDLYHKVNVAPLADFLQLSSDAGVQRFVQISSLGVYPARDHYGTKEDMGLEDGGIDAYTRSKLSAERIICNNAPRLDYTILRPGFIYGSRDRQVLPRLIKRLVAQKLVYVGDGNQLLNNTYVKNLSHAVFLSMDHPNASRAIFNVTDAELVSRKSFIGSIARHLSVPEPRIHLPKWLMSGLADVVYRSAKLARLPGEPPLTPAAIKFLSLNLQFSIEKIKRELGYNPPFKFAEGLAETFAEGVDV